MINNINLLKIFILIVSLFSQFILVSADYNKVSELISKYKSTNSANKLASLWIIQDNSSNPDNYRLGDSITRWEMAKIISKISWIEVINNCEWKYIDLVSSDWECKYAESWLKNNYFSDSNFFRPKDNITKIEALKMIMKAKWIEKTDNLDWKVAYVEWAEKVWLIYNKFSDYDLIVQRNWIFDLASRNIWNIIKKLNFKAEYFWNSEDYKVSDYINLDIDWKVNKIKWIYEASKKNIECVEKQVSSWSKIPVSKMLCGGVSFWGFEEFSPSWYYLLYSYWSYESFGLIMQDTRTWEIVIKTFWWNFYSWTKDRKQFIYWGEDWMWTDRWLYITIKWSFPELKNILDESIIAWYIDDKNIYVITQDLENLYYKKIIDIKTEKIIYSEEIK